MKNILTSWREATVNSIYLKMKLNKLLKPDRLQNRQISKKVFKFWSHITEVFRRSKPQSMALKIFIPLRLKDDYDHLSVCRCNEPFGSSCKIEILADLDLDKQPDPEPLEVCTYGRRDFVMDFVYPVALGLPDDSVFKTEALAMGERHIKQQQQVQQRGERGRQDAIKQTLYRLHKATHPTPLPERKFFNKIKSTFPTLEKALLAFKLRFIQQHHRAISFVASLERCEPPCVCVSGFCIFGMRLQ